MEAEVLNTQDILQQSQSQNDGKCVGKSLDNNFHNQLKQQQKGWIKNCNIITHLIFHPNL